MRFLDVCLNPAAKGKKNHPIPYILIVQGDYVGINRTRVAVPLMRSSEVEAPIPKIMPLIMVGDEQFVVMTPQIIALPVGQIGAVVASASDAHSDIRRAIDVLTGDF
ncbi:CcdB family protein [Azospirillum sp. A26]|uniref:CcdB family protein n=1 Tax=Azospirillum sp. A26 TaxID=3160607 RepID=UPI00366C669E